jgi:hexosaminidase
MYRRMESLSGQLEWLGITHLESYRLMLERLRGGDDIAALRVLADVLEPVKEYARPHTQHYETTTPLNRLVDAVRPESDAARNFAALAQKLVNKSATAEDMEAMRKSLIAWRDNDQQLGPLLQSNPLLQEAIPLSQSLSSVAAIGSQALEHLRAGRHAPPGWRQHQLDAITQAQKPQAELLNMIVPPVQKLVEALPSD